MTILEAITWIIALAACGGVLGILAWCAWTVLLAFIEFINFLIDVLTPEPDEGDLPGGSM